jgi:CBS domain-containing protein
MLVSEFMTAAPVYCTTDTPLEEVARLMELHDCGALPVVSQDQPTKPIGVITDRDIVCRVLAKGDNPVGMVAHQCMTNSCVTVPSSASLEDCCELMEAHHIRRLVAVDKSGGLCGIVAQADLARVAPESKVGEVVQEISFDVQPTF